MTSPSAPAAPRPRRARRHYQRELARWLGFFVPEGSRVLDLGCVGEEILPLLRPADGTGVRFREIPTEAPPVPPADGRIRYVERPLAQGSVSRLPDGGPFDYVCAVDLLGYVDDIQGFLEEARALCRPETRVLLTKTNPLWGPAFRLAARLGIVGPRRYSNWLGRAQCRRIVQLAGFEVVQEDSFLLFPAPVPFVAAFFNRFVARLPFVRRLGLAEGFVCRLRPEPMPAAPSVTVVIPCRNERGNVRAALERMPSFPGPLEVVFVEGHSSDGTWEEIQAVIAEGRTPFPVRAFRQAGKGKGDAVRLGFDEARHDLLMILDADLTVPPEELPRFYEVLASRRAEYVHGTRLVYPMEREAMRPLNWLGNKFFSWVISFLSGQPISDALCGTKCLSRAHYRRLAAQRGYFGDFDPFGDFDLIFGAAKLGLKIEEVPVHYKSRTYGETQIDRFRDGMLLLRMCAFAARKLRFT